MPELDGTIQDLIKWVWGKQGDCQAALCNIEAPLDENEGTATQEFYQAQLAAFEDVGQALVSDRWKNPKLQLGGWLDDQAVTDDEQPGKTAAFDQVRRRIAELPG